MQILRVLSVAIMKSEFVLKNMENEITYLYQEAFNQSMVNT